jgi:hypothetical protein
MRPLLWFAITLAMPIIVGAAEEWQPISPQDLTEVSPMNRMAPRAATCGEPKLLVFAAGCGLCQNRGSDAAKGKCIAREASDQAADLCFDRGEISARARFIRCCVVHSECRFCRADHPV